MFYYLSQSVGSGKTAAILDYIRDNLGSGYLYVAPTISLCEEIYSRLVMTLAEHPEYVNSDKIKLVVGDDAKGKVYPRAVDACRDYDQNCPPIVIITEKTFQYILENLEDAYKKMFHVFVDEGLSPIQTISFSTNQHEDFLGYFDQDEDGFIKPAQGQKEILQWVARAPAKLIGHGLQHLETPQFKTICELVISQNYDVFLSRTQNAILCVGLLSPLKMHAFKSVTLVVAIFDKTLFPRLWKQRHDVIFEAFDLNCELYDTHLEKGPSITIYHILHEGDNASKRNLNRNADTHDENERDESKKIIYRAAEQINAAFPEGAYCWVANNNFGNVNGVLQGKQMPAQCAGMDEFKLYNTVVSLLCINPQPWVKNILVDLFELETEELYDLWRFSHTYQSIGRCSLRMRERNDDITIVVVSKRCADQLQELFVGSTIKGQLTDIPKCGSIVSRGRPSNFMGNGSFTPADNKAYSVYKKRTNNKGGDVLEKQEWYKGIRCIQQSKKG